MTKQKKMAVEDDGKYPTSSKFSANKQTKQTKRAHSDSLSLPLFSHGPHSIIHFLFLRTLPCCYSFPTCSLLFLSLMRPCILAFLLSWSSHWEGGAIYRAGTTRARAPVNWTRMNRFCCFLLSHQFPSLVRTRLALPLFAVIALSCGHSFVLLSIIVLCPLPGHPSSGGAVLRGYLWYSSWQRFRVWRG